MGRRIQALRRQRHSSFTPDQEEIVEAALKLIKEKTGTKFDTVALEYMAQSFMGTGIAFADATSALNAEYKKAGDISTFLERVVAYVQEITGKEISVSYEDE